MSRSLDFGGSYCEWGGGFHVRGERKNDCEIIETTGVSYVSSPLFEERRHCLAGVEDFGGGVPVLVEVFIGFLQNEGAFLFI